MIYITGDTHGNNDIGKLTDTEFPEGNFLSRNDYLIIAGDFGGIWTGDERDEERLKFFKERKYIVLFVDGNHENFHALNRYKRELWNGGKIHRIADNIIHLMRGQIYELEGKTFFTFGGGISIDKLYRIPGISWWPEENPSYEEIGEALDNLDACGNKVDYIITHAAPKSIVRNEIAERIRLIGTDCPTEAFLDEILRKVSFKEWFCGHYHADLDIPLSDKRCLHVLYNTIQKK